MHLFSLILAVFLSFFSTAVMSYISMAMPIGPWIETTVVLIGILLVRLLYGHISDSFKTKTIGLATAAAGIGGILATGMGFSFPVLAFIDSQTFGSLIASPVYFCIIIGFLAFAGGAWGLFGARLFEKNLLLEQKLSFPIGELVYKMLSASQEHKVVSLVIGFVTTTIGLFVQYYTTYIASTIVLMRNAKFGIFNIPLLAFRPDMVPMFLAVGFITGHLIVFPLLVGIISKLLLLEPLYYIHSNYPLLPNFLQKFLTIEEFSVAFCSGMVLYGVVTSFLGFPKFIKNFFKQIRDISAVKEISVHLKSLPLVEGSIAIGFAIAFLSKMNFSLLSQCYILISTIIWIYQVLVIAGKFGMAPLGRFATFVMVPGMLFFGWTMLQVTIVSTFVEIAVGVASDVLFGRKMAELADIDQEKVVRYQWLGLIVSILCIGILVWLLLTQFSIGPTGDLPVNKAYSRALLIGIRHFDVLILAIGILFSYLLTRSKVNPTLVLGGILMPPSLSLLLIAGGLLTYVVKDKEELYPFWSGVFAANSLWLIFIVLFRTLFS